MKHLVKIFMIVCTIIIVAFPVLAEPKKMSIADFEKYSYNSEQLILNNFTIYEDEDDWFGPSGWNTLRIKLSGKNNSTDSITFEIQTAGLNANREVLWCMKVQPMMGVISEKTLEEVSGSAYVKPGTLSKTDTVVIIFAGDLW